MNTATRTPNIFVGTPVSISVRHTLQKIAETLKAVSPKCKWLHHEDYHLTFKFLGPISPELIDDVSDIVRQTSLTCSPFTVTVKGLGTFDKHGKPVVLWAGIDPLPSSLSKLHEALVTSFAKGDCGDTDGIRESENGTYQPHITLARINRLERTRFDQKIINALSAYDSINMPVNEIAVMFNAGGEPPHYRVYKSFALSPAVHGK